MELKTDERILEFRLLRRLEQWSHTREAERSSSLFLVLVFTCSSRQVWGEKPQGEPEGGIISSDLGNLGGNSLLSLRIS